MSTGMLVFVILFIIAILILPMGNNTNKWKGD